MIALETMVCICILLHAHDYVFHSIAKPSILCCIMYFRFSPSTRKSLKTYVLQLVNEQLSRHNMPADNVSRNLLKFLINAVGFPELRLLVAQKIDSWIQNPKVCMVLCKKKQQQTLQLAREGIARFVSCEH